MSIFEAAAAERAARDGDRPPQDTPDSDDTTDADDHRDTRPEQGAGTARLTAARDTPTVHVDGEEVPIAAPDTTQPDEEGTWLTGSGYGRPRGTDALEHRQIVQTSAMQAIVNGVASNIVGGELTFEATDAMDALGDAQQDAAEDLRELVRQVLTGPHLQTESLDDLIVAAVEDIMGPGQAVWQLLESETGSVPVAALTTLDPLTIRHTRNKHGVFGDPPYWQAAGAFSGGSMTTVGNIDPVPLDHDDIAVMDYPLGNRSYRGYPVSPAWQVREWLEILANSTTHHNRFYSDNEIPPGLMQIVNASDNTITSVKEKIEAASGDPRDVPIIGGEGGAQWLDMGGTAVNLNVIEEQRWFFFLCLGSLGLGKQDLGFVEDVNRSNGEVEATRVYKRVTGPFINQFETAFRKVARQFDAYRDLGEPFRPTIAFSDPREERAREQRLREQLQAGAITPRQYARRTADEDIAADDDRFVVEIAGETIDYGAHPVWVSKRLMAAASGEQVDVDGEPDDTPDDGDGGSGDTPQGESESESSARHPLDDGGV